jgi:cyclic beta-1,2-glucan synthetase
MFTPFNQSAKELDEEPIRAELFSHERLEQHARSLAAAQVVTTAPRKVQSLAARVENNRNQLRGSLQAIAHAERDQRAITPAAEWLLDNFHVVEEQIADIHDHLPDRFYRELPKLAEGPLAGYPRVYGISWAFVAHTDSHFTSEQLVGFVSGYQEVAPLTMGEIWALPITLRVVLVENLCRFARKITNSQRGRQLANQYLNEIESTDSRTQELRIELPEARFRRAFAVQLVQRLRDQHLATSFATDLLNDWLAEQKLNVDELVQREHAAQSAANLSVRNIISSMRLISAFDWRSFFESISLVEQQMRSHPTYASMDFASRDRYRHAIEDLAKHSAHTELAVAQLVLKKILAPEILTTTPIGINPRVFDSGYFLIAEGRDELEIELNYQPPLLQRLKRYYSRYPVVNYLTSIAVLTLCIVIVLAWISLDAGVTLMPIVLLVMLSLFPASDIAVALVNRLVTLVFKPRHLPRIQLEAGPSIELKTVVAVPALLTSIAAIRAQIAQMEVYYLANPNGAVYFAVLSDWVDSNSEISHTDEELLVCAREQIALLNTRHSTLNGSRFYLFHRRRRWNEGEGKWMGWERKRGKLTEFNRLLRGATDTSFLPQDPSESDVPTGVRYVITLDADTKLPIDTVSQLVGIACHPLNQPRFDSAEQRTGQGYGVLQPRVTATLPQREERSVFQRMFSAAGGVDAYAGAASDVYQDLFGEGSFTGKGLYDIDAFDRALAGRVPANRLLSHDLFEGTFARCALVSDVEVFEDFPSHVEVAAARQHRWARGDWQLLPWIFGPLGRDIPAIGRWKMLDNLRRTLSAPAALLLLALSWALPRSPQALWIALVVTALAVPTVIALFDSVVALLKTKRWLLSLRGFGEKLLLATGQVLFAVTLLAHHAWLMIDAIVRTLVRLLITKRKLLEWTTAAQAKALSGFALTYFLWPLRSATGVVIGASAVVLYFNPSALRIAAPLLVLWWVAPLFARTMSLPPTADSVRPLSLTDTQYLRGSARRIWHFFTTFVAQEDNHLPPDNFQEDPQPAIAHRTSPTNIGLYLLSTVTARDFGWLGLLDMTERLELSLASLSKLERHRGHLFNWYDTRTMLPLEPRYVSTVDSGNLAGHLLALKQACVDLARQPIVSAVQFTGVTDTLRLFQSTLAATKEDRRAHLVTIDELQHCAGQIELCLLSPVARGRALFLRWQALAGHAAHLRDLCLAFTQERGEVDSELMAWAVALDADVHSVLRDIDVLLPWLKTHINELDDDAEQTNWSAKLETEAMTVAALSDCGEHSLSIVQESLPSSLNAALTTAIAANRSLSQRLHSIAEQAQRLFSGMEFGFLFDQEKRLFSIGYKVADGLLDPSFYDLLASEARLTSLIAIAKRDVPVRHWFRLGRRLTSLTGGPALLSWSGSMFEYLMPSLVLHTPDGSMLDFTCKRIIQRQIEYAQAAGTPWGISESAFYVRDRAFTYQYADFGVPGLGLKRGLEQDRVVAPYATALAAMYAAHAALANFRTLDSIGGRGRYGYFEALDYTPERLPEGQTMARVRAYMAHHQGMSLVALANTVNDGLMRQRFHREPLIKSIELLLQERTPDAAPALLVQPAAERRVRAVQNAAANVRRFKSPHTAVPATHLLSNGRYAVMLTAAGSGYSLWGKLAITRWREDVTRDCWGSYIFLRDTSTGAVWSAAYQPTVQEPEHYFAAFFEERVRIARRDGDIACTLEVVVSPEDNAEVRLLKLVNNGSVACELELTSYMEVVLAPLAADLAHPAFANLFIETEYVADTRALLAKRRPRSEHEPQIWAAHVIACAIPHSIEYETDRARFIGRGHDVHAPIAVLDGRPLSNTVGAVLDPIFSLRTRVRIEPGATVQVTFSTMVGDSRDTVLDLADKYSDPAIFERISALAWTFAQVQLHYLHIESEEALWFQSLANHVLFPDPSLRPSAEFLSVNRLGASALWRHRISGDRPMIVLRITTADDIEIVRQLLRAHEYWHIKCLAVDLLILNERSVSYAQDLQQLLEGMVRANQTLTSHDAQEIEGSIYVLRADLLSTEERVLILTAARAVLVAGQGSLIEQLDKPAKQDRPSAFTLARVRRAAFEAIKVPVPELQFFNGLGGFSTDGREYVTVLNKGQNTPAPWVNVVANPNFGFLVSESGGGYTFARNSRENQLTPWSNDTVADPAGEIFYLRDEDNGWVWTPTARPIRLDDTSYVTRHGQGYSSFHTGAYGIASELEMFASWHDPVKISCLRLKNYSSVIRKISVTAYVEWVLGSIRGMNSPFIVTERDEETGALFARNPWNTDFGEHIAFADFAGRQTAWTCDRTEFLGRNGSFRHPAALQRGVKLSGRTGAGLDPCAVLQTTVEILPEQQVELVFYLGQSDSQESVRSLLRRLRATRPHKILGEVKNNWGNLLTTVQVRTPDAAMNILLNGWLLYQTLACRYWARAGFYQAGGAYGFRDQLQDGMAITLVAPELAREHILRAAGRQFVEGDVQHWWHPPTGRGVRTHFSDDRIWLPYVTAHYVAVTGDNAILDEVVPFLEGRQLPMEQEDAFFEPVVSERAATLFDHCTLALDVSLTTGAHGLPLMGGGDWNDGMNRVGHKGQGESVWLAWFLHTTLLAFANLAESRDAIESSTRWRNHAAQLKNAAEAEGWDGNWYRRAYFDDGTPLGSSGNTECRIDSLAQSWSVISGAADPARARQAMTAVDDYLVRTGDDLVLLFTPPFEKTALDPGYIKGYLPGVRENGGQYTHAAVWTLIANSMLGEGDRVGELFNMLNPINRTATRAGMFAYKVEPYVVAADVYAESPHTRRGGWTWYTGAAGWLYQAGIESILGLRIRADKLSLQPCIPSAWRSYTATFRHKTSVYEVIVENPSAVNCAVASIELDNKPHVSQAITLSDDGATHVIRVLMGEQK